ncbi:anti-repressor SinI family protein [Mesobacillus foraminis]|nr:anti-repressor SinI family protein [Mesobacillus foraminis]
MEKALHSELDAEWVNLIKEALELGINKEEIRDFLNSDKADAVAVGS